MRRERERPYQSGSVDVSIVVPAHNEEGNILPLMDQFGELARRARFSFEVVAVDDGSRDRTLPRLVDAQRVHRFIRIVSLPRRRGLTEALQAGFAASRGHTIVFYPADRQFHPNDIPRMVERLRDGYDLVTGRKIGQYNKRVVSGLYNRLSRWLFPSINVTDLNSVKAFRRELIDVFDYRHDWHRFWVAIAAEAGYRIGEVDVTLYQRTTGTSKFGWWRIPGGVLDLLAVKFQYHTMRRPLWYFGMTGTVLFAIAVLIGGWAVYLRFV
ncbi:MAG: glycosyltransferase family 2 protein, partial [Candidatus Zixiibacteriota bacterium]